MAASKNKKPSRQSNAAGMEPSPRHLWLASLGALVAVRRESKSAVKRANTRIENAVADTRHALRRAEADLRASIDGVRSRVQPKMHKFGNDVEARLAPIADKLGLDKFGLKAKSRRAPRKSSKPAAKKPSLRRASRKTAKRVTKHVAS